MPKGIPKAGYRKINPTAKYGRKPIYDTPQHEQHRKAAARYYRKNKDVIRKSKAITDEELEKKLEAYFQKYELPKTC